MIFLTLAVFLLFIGLEGAVLILDSEVLSCIELFRMVDKISLFAGIKLSTHSLLCAVFPILYSGLLAFKVINFPSSSYFPTVLDTSSFL